MLEDISVQLNEAANLDQPELSLALPFLAETEVTPEIQQARTLFLEQAEIFNTEIIKLIDTILFFITADPPTLGHHSVISLLDHFLETQLQMLVIPPFAYVSESKKPIDPEYRFAMLQLMLKGYAPERVMVSELEIKSGKAVETGESIEHFIRENATRKPALVMGADSILKFKYWDDWQQVVEQSPIIVVPRAGMLSEQIIQRLQADPGSADITTLIGKRIFFINIPDSFPLQTFEAASSSSVRKQLQEMWGDSAAQVIHQEFKNVVDQKEAILKIQNHSSFKKLTPHSSQLHPEVFAYIIWKGIYQGTALLS